MSLFVSDADTDSDVDYGAWSDSDTDLRRVLVSPYELQIATARYDSVQVRLVVHDRRPAPNLTATHVVESDLETPSGRLALSTVTGRCAEVEVRGDRQRVRITYENSGAAPDSNPDEPGDHYLYLIESWPVEMPQTPETVVQGPQVWAG